MKKFNKFKKVAAAILGAAMMLTSMSATVFASPEIPGTTQATIDESKKGSLQIHKYTGDPTTGENGTGESSDAENVPADAEPLKDVGFTLYKVADVEDMKSYYSANPTELPAATAYYSGSGKNITVDASKVKETVAEIKTDANGIATFENLTLGFYLVVETSSPALVTGPVAPFLVSVPMTTVDGDDWLYDIHVYPKNDTTVGSVKLVKQDGNGNGLEGVTFVLQKQNGETWTNITKQTTAQGDNTGTDLDLVTDANGNISVSGLSNGTYRFIETSVGNNHGFIMDGAAVYTFTVTDGVVDCGNGSTSFTINNYKPDMTKEVQDRTDSSWGQDSDYSVGDTVPYRVTVKVPANIAKLKEFNLTDTPTNLKDDTTSVKVTYDEADVVADAYSVAVADNGFKITFVPAKMEAYAGKDIVVSYNATLLSTAVTTTEGNPNTAALEYSNSILPATDDGSNPNKPDETPDKDVIKDNATVYTFKLNVLKTGENNAKLQNVTFDLYKYDGTEAIKTENDLTTNGGTKINVTGADGVYVKDAAGTAVLTTNAEGSIKVSGLSNGTYYLVETKTNDEYNLLKEPVKVTLAVEYITSMTESWEWEVVDGVKTLVKHEITTSKTTFTNTDDTTGKDGYKTQTVINKKGFTLPTTGGMGTVIFTIIGIALAAAGVMIILGSRKKSAAK